VIVDAAGGSALTAVTSTETMADGRVLVAGRPLDPRLREGKKTHGIYAIGSDDVESVFDTRDWDEIEAVPVVPTSPSRARPSAVDLTRKSGVLICYDSSRSDGKIGPPPGSKAPATLVVQGLPPRRPRELISRGDGAIAILRRTIESDGSFMIDIPADRAVRVQTFDSEDAIIATSGWFWVRPGEVRSCFGCHERRQEAPVNRPVMALRSTLAADQPARGVGE
jgi:hypothetical protein